MDIFIIKRGKIKKKKRTSSKQMGEKINLLNTDVYIV